MMLERSPWKQWGAFLHRSVLVIMLTMMVLAGPSAAEELTFAALKQRVSNGLDCHKQAGVFCPSYKSRPLGAWCPSGFQCKDGDFIRECPKGWTSPRGSSKCKLSDTMIAGLSFLGIAFLACCISVAGNEDAFALAVLPGMLFIILVAVAMEGNSPPSKCNARAGDFCPSSYSRSKPCPDGHYCLGGETPALPCCDSPDFINADACAERCDKNQTVVSLCTAKSDHVCTQQRDATFQIDCVTYQSFCDDLSDQAYCAHFANAAQYPFLYEPGGTTVCDNNGCADAASIRKTSYDLYVLNYSDMVVNLAVLLPKFVDSLIRGDFFLGFVNESDKNQLLQLLAALMMLLQFAETGLDSWEVHMVRTLPESFERFQTKNCITRQKSDLLLELQNSLESLRLLAPIQLFLSLIEVLVAVFFIFKPTGQKAAFQLRVFSLAGTAFLTGMSVLDFAIYTLDFRAQVERLYTVAPTEGDVVWCLLEDRSACEDIQTDQTGAGRVSFGLQWAIGAGLLVGVTCCLCGGAGVYHQFKDRSKPAAPETPPSDNSASGQGIQV